MCCAKARTRVKVTPSAPAVSVARIHRNWGTKNAAEHAAYPLVMTNIAIENGHL